MTDRLHFHFHSHNLHFKITELARRFNPETVLRQDTLLYNPKECRGNKIYPFFLLDNSRPLSPWGPLPRKWLSHGDCSHKIKRQSLLLGRKGMTKVDSIFKSRDISLLTKVHIVKAMAFPVVQELDHKEGWAPKNWCFQTVLLKTLESSLGSKEMKPVNPKGNQSWVFIEMTDAEAEVPILWPCDAKNWLIWKNPDAGKDWRQEEKRTTENKMIGWHHWLNEHEFKQTKGNSEGLGSLKCWSPWGHN